MSSSASSVSVGTVLRYSKESIPVEILKLVEGQIGDYESDELNTLPDLQKDFSTQLLKYKQAFDYVLEAYPPTQFDKPISDELKTAILNQVKTSYLNSIKQLEKIKNEDLKEEDTFNKFQKILINFNSHLIGLIDHYWKVDVAHKEAIEALNVAEQYVTSENGRDNLATVFPLAMPGIKESDKADKFYLLQLEKTLNPCNKKFIKEVLLIAGLKLNTPMQWNSLLTTQERQFLLQTKFSSYNFIEVYSELDNLRRKLKLIKEEDVSEIFIEQLSEVQTQYFSVIMGDDASISVAKAIVAINQSTSNFAKAKSVFSELKAVQESYSKAQVPSWYLAMSKFENHLLYHKVKDLKSDKDVINSFQFLSSKHRTIPIPANYALHTSYLIKNGEVVYQTSEKVRSAHGASRDVTNQSQDIQDRHANDNYTKVIEDQVRRLINDYQKKYGKKPTEIPVLLQTLISPIKIPGLKIPDPNLDTQKLRSVEQLHGMRVDGVEINIIPTNHPLNYARNYQYTGFYTLPDSNYHACDSLLKLTDDYLKTLEKNSLEYAELLPLYDLYHETLKSGMGSSTWTDNFGRELCLSSLEQLIIPRIGGMGHITCVSGKDRMAISAIHADAMELFLSQMKRWPNFESAIDRQHFVDLVAQEFMVRHHQVHAGQNSPGCEGVKTPAMYLPSDICQRINDLAGFDLTAIEDSLATNNELKRTGKEEMSMWRWAMNLPPGRTSVTGNNALVYQAQVGSLSVEKVKLLVDSLSEIVNHKSWGGQSSWLKQYTVGGEPHYITKMGTSTNNEKLENSEKLAQILKHAHEAVVAGSSYRSPKTAMFYSIVDSLVNSPTPEKEIDIVLSLLGDFSKTFNITTSSASSSVPAYS